MMFHTFVISAYEESPYLESCIRSLKAQTVPSEIICTTISDEADGEISDPAVRAGGQK